MSDVQAALRAARKTLDAAIKAIDETRTELIRVKRQLGEQLDELTPVRPPSRTDIKAAFDGAQQFNANAADALKGKP
jgi:hypothetical protein